MGADKDGEDDGRGQSAQPRCSPEARPQERGHGTHTLRCCRCTCRGQETQGLWAREEPADGGEHLAPQACPRASPPTRSSTAAAIPAPPANLSTTDVRKSGGRGRLAIFSHSRCRQEQEMRLKKLDCERNMCSHLEGESKLNCNYKCISEPCHSEIYGHDEVEEGEVDSERSRLFGFCFRRNFRQEMEARKERMRQEAADQRARSHSVDRRGL